MILWDILLQPVRAFINSALMNIGNLGLMSFNTRTLNALLKRSNFIMYLVNYQNFPLRGGFSMNM